MNSIPRDKETGNRAHVGPKSSPLTEASGRKGYNAEAASVHDTLVNEAKAKAMAREGKTITSISNELDISWNEVRSYTPSWLGAKKKLTNRLVKLVSEPDRAKRSKLAAEADRYADFLYDAAKHLRGQVDGARKALDR